MLPHPFGAKRAAYGRRSVAIACIVLASSFVAPARSDDVPGEVTNAIPIPAIKPGFPVSGGAAFQRPPMLVDLDQDGRYEILGIEQVGNIHVVGVNGIE